jgi:hypothetical protein
MGSTYPVHVERGVPWCWVVSSEDMAPLVAMLYPDVCVTIPYWPSSMPPVPAPPPGQKGTHKEGDCTEGGYAGFSDSPL